MKKFVSLLVTLCLMLSLVLVPVQAGACETQMGAAVARMNHLQATNARWSWKDAQQHAGLLIVEVANARIEEIIVESCKLAEKTNCEVEIAAIIVSMRVRCKVVSEVAQEAAKLCGVETVCEYIEVEIGGHKVMVDPLRVILV